MGYRSDVAILVAFKNREQMEEVLAIYQMHPDVAKYNIMPSWRINVEHKPPYMTFSTENVKWYSDYEDVKAYEHITYVCEEFDKNRGFEYVCRVVRIGEEDSDVEIRDSHSDDSYDLIDFALDHLYVRRSIECSF